MRNTGSVRKSKSDLERQRAAWRDSLPAVAVLAMTAIAMVIVDSRGQALAFGFAVVVLLLLVAGLLDAAGVGDPRQGMQVSFIGGVLAWMGARAVKARKA